MNRLVITPLAASDIEEIGDYIAQDNPSRAVRFMAELRMQCRKIAAAPQAYRLRPELGDGIRSCAHGNYVIFFCASYDEVSIVRVLHGARDIGAQFGG